MPLYTYPNRENPLEAQSQVRLVVQQGLLPNEAPENLISSRKIILENSIPFCFYQNVLANPEKKQKKNKKKTHSKKKKRKKKSDQLVSIFQSLIIVPRHSLVCLCPVRLRVQACAQGPRGGLVCVSGAHPAPPRPGVQWRVSWSMFTGCKYHFYTPHRRPT